MSIHLHRFIDRLRAEARGAKDFTMSISDAKDLHADITRLLVDLQNMREAMASQATQEEVIKVQVQGGTF